VGCFDKTEATKSRREKIAVKAITCTGCIKGVDLLSGNRLQARRRVTQLFDQYSTLCSTS
jgi:hypothetical protein